MKERFNLFCMGLAIAVLVGSLAETSAQSKNVILYLGDGFGVAPRTAVRMALGQGKDGKRFSADLNFQQLALDKLKYNGMVTTHSLNSWITDSAPGAAVYACGKVGKVDNEVISMDVETAKPFTTILEIAKKNGYAVGIVTTTRITHASPAVFASHIWNRDLENYIAAQYISTSEAEYEDIFKANGGTYNPATDWILPAPKVGVEVDVILGGGSRQFIGKSLGDNNIVKDRNGKPILKANGLDTVKLGKSSRPNNTDLIEIAKSRGYQYVNSRDALLGIDLNQFTQGGNKKLIGLFRDSHCSYEQDRQLTFQHEPTLAEMTKIAIEVLKRKSSKGFFLFVEGGRIDHLEHGNAGGIGYSTDKKNYIVTADLEAQPDDGQYSTDTTKTPATVPQIYGSDYMIKEVLAFDYSIAEGRKLLEDPSSKTLILATSDHECGGFAVVGLHDESDSQANKSKIRTYAQQPIKSNKEFTPPPVGIVRGDASIGGWFPEYTMEKFQDYSWPKAPATGRRIVIAYGSNPNTNGNTTARGGTPGNHTPQDILVSADDNSGGEFARRVSGRGLLDNTDLTPIMEDFLGVKIPLSVKIDDDSELKTSGKTFPNPAFSGSPIEVEFSLEHSGNVSIEIYNTLGQRVRLFEAGLSSAGIQRIFWDGKDDFGSALNPGAYYFSIRTVDGIITEKTIVF